VIYCGFCPDNKKCKDCPLKNIVEEKREEDILEISKEPKV